MLGLLEFIDFFFYLKLPLRLSGLAGYRRQMDGEVQQEGRQGRWSRAPWWTRGPGPDVGSGPGGHRGRWYRDECSLGHSVMRKWFCLGLIPLPIQQCQDSEATPSIKAIGHVVRARAGTWPKVWNEFLAFFPSFCIHGSPGVSGPQGPC